MTHHRPAGGRAAGSRGSCRGQAALSSMGEVSSRSPAPKTDVVCASSMPRLPPALWRWEGGTAARCIARAVSSQRPNRVGRCAGSGAKFIQGSRNDCGRQPAHGKTSVAAFTRQIGQRLSVMNPPNRHHRAGVVAEATHSMASRTTPDPIALTAARRGSRAKVGRISRSGILAWARSVPAATACALPPAGLPTCSARSLEYNNESRITGRQDAVSATWSWRNGAAVDLRRS